MEEHHNIALYIVWKNEKCLLYKRLNIYPQSRWILLKQMACLQALKQDIKILESLFTSENERFRILSASVDEVTCEFTGGGDERVRINANITVSIGTNVPLC